MLVSTYYDHTLLFYNVSKSVYKNARYEIGFAVCSKYTLRESVLETEIRNAWKRQYLGVINEV